MSTALRRCPRSNPFRVDRVRTVRYRLGTREWELLLEAFERLHRRASLVGPEGSGKTTLREDMERRLRNRGWNILPLQLSTERRSLQWVEWLRLARADRGTIVTLDGAEQLGWLQFAVVRGLTCRVAGLLTTSHKPRGLPVLRRHASTLAVLTGIAGELLRDDGTTVPEPYLARLYARCNGNIRECLRALYDRWMDRSLPMRAVSAVLTVCVVSFTIPLWWLP